MKLTNSQIREKYKKFAPKYDLLEAIPDFLVLRRFRKRLLQNAHGRVLEVAAGTGRNFKYYKNCKVTAVDITPEMLNIARKKSKKIGLNAEFNIMDTESLKFKNNSFDAVVSTLSLCTFPNPFKALKEMSRVCRKNGRILLLDHGISSSRWIRSMQKKMAPKHFEMIRCRLDIDPFGIAKKAGLGVIKSKRHVFGMFYIIEAKPKK